MYTFASRPSEMINIKFEDFKDHFGDKQAVVYQPKTSNYKTMMIPEALYQKIEEYKEHLKSIKKYKHELRINQYNEEIQGHFLFDLTDSTISKLFSERFKGVIPERLKFRAKDLRICALNQIKDVKGIEGASLAADHSSTKITRSHYIRTGVDIDAEIQKRQQD
jgi:hypothetical protein